MAYFYANQDRMDRIGKIVADFVGGVLLLTFALVFFGWLGGVVAFVILYGAMLGVDFLVPDEHAHRKIRKPPDKARPGTLTPVSR